METCYFSFIWGQCIHLWTAFSSEVASAIILLALNNAYKLLDIFNQAIQEFF